MGLGTIFLVVMIYADSEIRDDTRMLFPRQHSALCPKAVLTLLTIRHFLSVPSVKVGWLRCNPFDI